MKTCLIYPERIKSGGISLQEYYVTKHGFNITTNPEDYWDFGLHINFRERNQCPEVMLNKLVINKYCNDVTKTHVEKVSKMVLGYGSFANPSIYGIAVRKSEKQCAKDFRVVETPCRMDEGFVYQRFLNSRIDVDWVRDFRFYFAFDRFVLVKRDKHIEGTFYGGKAKQKFDVVDWGKYFKGAEIDNIIEIKNRLGMDVGAIDVVRDYSDNRIYVLDVNNISGIPQFIVNCIDRWYSKLFIDELNARL
jgi:hypothetical protein